jgi:hypothetical protein
MRAATTEGPSVSPRLAAQLVTGPEITDSAGARNAEYARLLVERDPLTCRARMIRFGAWLGVARSHRRAGLLS